jgi:hypothetical protein
MAVYPRVAPSLMGKANAKADVSTRREKAVA